MSLDSTDLFCGAGGSGLGAHSAGVTLYMAANHPEIAIDTHAANFPDTEHDCADISQVNPKRYRTTTFLWASPECTNHSQAKGRKRTAQLDLFSEPDPTAERSRATMWDVPRFAEHHRYRFVIVENVVEAASWELWPAWLYAMKCLGYEYRVVSLNSMHAAGEKAPRAPQSRDRIYVVFWRKGTQAPDLEPRPLAWCPTCELDVDTRQWWKPNRTIGRYRSQYLYRCSTCHEVVEPYALPAAVAIDWSVRGKRIGDRSTPLKPATMARIKAGLERYATAPQLIPAGGTWNLGSAPVSEPFRTRTTRETEALLVPLEARRGKQARPVEQAMRTQTARAETALVVPYYGNSTAQPSSRPLPTFGTVDTAGVAFIAELRGGGSKHRHVSEPLATFAANGTHHMLVRNNSSKGPGGEMCTPATEPARTITTRGHQSLVGWPHLVPAVEDCTFRMLQVPEIGAGMAFTPGYVIKGTKRQQVMQLGNAVTPPSSEWLYRRCIDVLEAAA